MNKSLAITAIITTFLFAMRPASAEVIGIWDIQSSPISASVISGGIPIGFLNQWLNVSNIAITPNDALSGMSILDDGIANLTFGTTYQLTYEPGAVLNIAAGPDLVLFDARYDAGSYMVSTSYDNFANEIFIPIADFLDTTVSRDYYFGGVPDEIFSTDIWGATIELSLLGVPQGVTVDHIRVRGVGAETSADFIGVGSFTGSLIPIPPAVWLFGSGLLGLVGIARRKAA